MWIRSQAVNIARLLARAKDGTAPVFGRSFNVKYGDQGKQGEMEIRDKEKQYGKVREEKKPSSRS